MRVTIGEMEMNPNDRDDDLWKVMGRAREPRVSEFFARNVLREVRAHEEGKAQGWIPAGWWKWALPATVAAMIAIAAVTLQISPVSSTVQLSAPSPSITTTEKALAELPIEIIKASPDYDVIAELDTLLAFEKNDTWLDSYASN